MSFQSAIADAVASIRSVAGVEVTYRRGSSWVRVLATQGSSTLESSDAYGRQIEKKTADWIVPACDLKFDSTRVIPQAGDTITRVSDGAVFTVHTPPFSPSDHAGTILRIHTIQTT